MAEAGTSLISFTTLPLSSSGLDDLLVSISSSFFITMSCVTRKSFNMGTLFTMISGIESCQSTVKTDEKKSPNTLAFSTFEFISVVLLPMLYRSGIEVFVFDFIFTNFQNFLGFSFVERAISFWCSPIEFLHILLTLPLIFLHASRSVEFLLFLILTHNLSSLLIN